jgi:hypothetical protein
MVAMWRRLAEFYALCILRRVSLRFVLFERAVQPALGVPAHDGGILFAGNEGFDLGGHQE